IQTVVGFPARASAHPFRSIGPTVDGWEDRPADLRQPEGTKMPGLLQKNVQSVGQVSVHGIWSKHRSEVTFDQLQKDDSVEIGFNKKFGNSWTADMQFVKEDGFWSELPPHARRELLRIDKQTLFEQARKNLYCSRCNGLLLEGFSQIVMYGKSLQQEGGSGYFPNRLGTSRDWVDDELESVTPCGQDDSHEPSVHPWGGLAATKDGMLTLLDCFLDGKSLRALQNVNCDEPIPLVFDSARARERERELLYPDACGGGGRGWISQGIANYGRGHGNRETCALHTARLSCDTLVDFWSALGDETRHSLLRMKEEDFIERLMYRFDSKRFCRDCRRNVIREFKELKELKRMRKELHCTNWFCVADTAFQYEVSEDTIHADWHQSFTDVVGTYHHFEWAVGTGEGKSDILEFEDVGTNGSVQVDGLDLGGLTACFITLRAWRLDGRCTELSVKAHALKGQRCVHRRLMVGDGYVTITKGESIRSFFEHAEEAEEEDDDDSTDKDGNELDGDGSRPQKHAKSPELAREFLLDAATVIFKEQIAEKGVAVELEFANSKCLCLPKKGVGKNLGSVHWFAINGQGSSIKGLPTMTQWKPKANGYAVTTSTATTSAEMVDWEENTRKMERWDDKKKLHKNCLWGRYCLQQVEKAFREGTARQNAHSIFVCLALKLLEERVHVACKEIITLEKQTKLLEEEEKEKREEEERKERRRTKEREKKQRRKERLKGKEKEKQCAEEQKQLPVVSFEPEKDSSFSAQEGSLNNSSSGDTISESGDNIVSSPLSSDITDEQSINGNIDVDGELNIMDGNGSFIIGQSKSSRRRFRFRKDVPLDQASRWCERRQPTFGSESSVQVDESEKFHGDMATSYRCIDGLHRQSRNNGIKPNARSCGLKFGEKFNSSNNRVRDRHEFQSCRCNLHTDHRSKSGQPLSLTRSVRDFKTANKSESASDVSRMFYHGNKYSHSYCISDTCVPKGKPATGNFPPSRGDGTHTKKVWEPMDSRKRYPRCNSDPDVTVHSSTLKGDTEGSLCSGNEKGCLRYSDAAKLFDECSSELPGCHEDGGKKLCNSSPGLQSAHENGFSLEPKSPCSKNSGNDEIETSSVINSTFPFNSASDQLMATSSSDNCSSCLSEGDSSIGSSGAQNVESSSTSDSEDASQQSECRDILTSGESTFHDCLDAEADGKHKINRLKAFSSGTVADQLTRNAHNSDKSRIFVDASSEKQNNQTVHVDSMHLPGFPTHSSVTYYHQCTASWAAAPPNGLVAFPQHSRYLYPTPVTYGVPSNPASPFCMQYGTVQPLTSPLLSVGQIPSHQMANKASIANSKDPTQNSKSGVQDSCSYADSVVNDYFPERPFSNMQLPQKGAPHQGQDACGGNPLRLNGSSSFSLFHFGGPVAVGAGSNSQLAASKDEVSGDFSKPLTDPVQSTLSCTKKEISIEEYSLFSASNRSQFSFF
ncbi:hypothetical protein ACLOJK_006615, partial [Asimina triloba]